MYKKTLYIVSICLLVLIPLETNISSLLYYRGYFNIYKYLNPMFIFVLAILVLIYIYIANLLKMKKWNKLDILFLLLAFIGIVVCIFAYDFKTSLLGSNNRHEGFITLFSYYLLFINWAKQGEKEDAIKWYKIIIYVAFFNALYSLLQTYTNYDFIVRMRNTNYASGFCGHNNFFGTLMTVALSMVSCKILSNNKSLSFKDLFLLLLFIVGLINCQSTGPVIAYFVTMLFMIIFLLIKKTLNWKILIAIIVIPVIIFFLVLIINKYVFHNQDCELCNFKANVIDNGGHDRDKIWKKTFSVVKKYPIIGVGYDNLAYLYPNGYKGVQVTPKGVIIDESIRQTKTYYLVDNAHNVYLNVLVSSGVIGLCIYLVLCFVTFIKGIKTDDRIYYIIFSGFVAYSVQAFVNINTILVAPIYYILIGIILSDNKK